MSKNGKENLSNPFAMLKKSDFPDQTEKNQKSEKIQKVKMQGSRHTVSGKNKHSTATAQSNQANRDDVDFFGFAEDEAENALFFANMANVQKVAEAPSKKTDAQKGVKKTTKETTATLSEFVKHSTPEMGLFAGQATQDNAQGAWSSMRQCTVADPDRKSEQQVNIAGRENSAHACSLIGEQDIKKALLTKGDIVQKQPFDVPMAFLQDLNRHKASISQNFINDESYAEKSVAMVHNVAFEKGKHQEKSPSQLGSSVHDNQSDAGDSDELSLFFRAVSDVKGLNGKGRDVAPEIIPAPVVPPPPPSNPLQDFMEGKLDFAVSCTDEYVEGHVLGLDLMTVGKLQARQYSPEAHIDLHGLNSEQAFHNLVAFFRNSYHRGLRTVLIVTGRGKNSTNGTPILRNKIQEWFTKDPFRRVVLAFCSAKIEDGGAGALYVLIRKQKKNQGKIQWDIQPTDIDFFM